MELVFLALLLLTMIVALGAGFPVAFSLPGAAILTIALAALTGFVFEGRVDAYFAHGDPIQWLNAGVTNFRGIYWEAERDTLIAIPLFIFMGIMLERSKIAEDLLITMAQLFGPIPGGLGISVVVVGALLAATTGIVGATVIAMGLISLPVMLRNNYSHTLATGTISASGTLGQIIPPSIVLIILADQLSNATDQASSIRTADYKAGTGNSSLPTEFDLTSTSAGDMFLGAFLPGLVLVGLYIVYILMLALIRPKSAPPAPYKGIYDFKFASRVFLVLMPPLSLIFIVLGSIVLGIATVNQAGAIGAIGALIMAGYRLMEGKDGAFSPAILSIISLLSLLILIKTHDINVKNIQGSDDVLIIFLAAIASFGLVFSIIWSGWRALKIDDTLKEVMIETSKTTSLVFIILLGAAMLTAAFRAFGGEELVRDFLTGLPGGFITKFIVVMGVIFLLGFFLDFIEIAVVVVPIIAPILLADPSANITAVWLGVMIGVNMQTSFLTPPFGFALFYLRGVAPSKVKTIEMYKGVIPFIFLQLIGLVIVGFYPALVNYLPARMYLTSETAPPPKNPRLQQCLEEYLFNVYDRDEKKIRSGINTVKNLDFSILPDKYKMEVKNSFEFAENTFDLIDDARVARNTVEKFTPIYKPMHTEAREKRVMVGVIKRKLSSLQKKYDRLLRENGIESFSLKKIEKRIKSLKIEQLNIESSFPDNWDNNRKKYRELSRVEDRARKKYRRNVDEAYEPIPKLLKLLSDNSFLADARKKIERLRAVVMNEKAALAIIKIKETESFLGKISGAYVIKARLSKARKALKRNKSNRQKANEFLVVALSILDSEVSWRTEGTKKLKRGLMTYNNVIEQNIGLRSQERLNSQQAVEIAACQSTHKNISLDF